MRESRGAACDRVRQSLLRLFLLWPTYTEELGVTVECTSVPIMMAKVTGKFIVFLVMG